jgi:hypothetical protein
MDGLILREYDRMEAPSNELAHISWVLAYIFLPKCIFSDPKMTIDYFSLPEHKAAALFYYTGCKLRHATPRHEHASQFRVHTRSILGNTKAYILEYPKPPPFDVQRLADCSPTPGQMPSADAPVLAPYFSAILHNMPTGGISYAVLGQGLTRLRLFVRLVQMGPRSIWVLVPKPL